MKWEVISLEQGKNNVEYMTIKYIHSFLFFKWTTIKEYYIRWFNDTSFDYIMDMENPGKKIFGDDEINELLAMRRYYTNRMTKDDKIKDKLKKL